MSEVYVLGYEWAEARLLGEATLAGNSYAVIVTDTHLRELERRFKSCEG